MTDVLWCDISEFQTPVDDSYPYRWLSFRSNDGTYRDPVFQQNLAWCKAKADAGQLDGFFVYCVSEPGEDWAGTLMSAVGEAHPLMAVMIDVESWGGRITGDQSADLNAGRARIGSWLGNAARVVGYGNAGDLESLWPGRGDTGIIYANYDGNPGFPGAFAHQYSSTGNVPPFGYPVDLNSADGFDSASLQQLLGLVPGAAPTPATAGTDYIGAVTVNRDVKAIQALVGANQDGIYGPDTTAKVIAYETAHNLTPDGIWGPLCDAVGFPAAPAPAQAGRLDVDGVLGPKTITLWQQIMGTTVDGTISTPSELVRAVQTRLNAAGARDQHGNVLDVDGVGIAQDGQAYRTVYALQVYLGTTRDGILSTPESEAVKALQARLNGGAF